MTGIEKALSKRQELFEWIRLQVYPLWSKIGVDHIEGGFFEKIDALGCPLHDPRRARVVGRQLYSFSHASNLGWDGSAEEIISNGLRFLAKYDNEEGGIHSVIEANGRVVRAEFDLYDYAFVLFGLAAVVEAYPSTAHLELRADSLLNHIYKRWKHPIAGFEEANPRTLPLKANPHMHMLESCLAWENVAPDNEKWSQLADEIVQLALDRFICPKTGALREFYDADWNPIPGEFGRIVEPGHQCEWAWLLARWGRSRRSNAAITTAKMLVVTAEKYGTDSQRGVMFNELNEDMSVRDQAARLWPQTERIKGWLTLYHLAENASDQDHALDRVCNAIDGLLQFRRPDLSGAYFDRLEVDGSFREEAAPASSLYHIICAARELQTMLTF
ncbi:Mannose-6-phosphate isomerase [Sphingobium chlorophenolicum L-1]|uniref:Mannose-6-phosphate isomerase n=1 Tax=Sphingobium chlorophenolicum L-1 TaxID=690566 RepID=F6F0M7_SPHCR|nr:AGE family epimerase/isomerase [Sphingobium chlorophenolicum]AEG50349.1 Mannose-6-phosphate isomerase [Sphingobium chlorophenolicum L-1]